jgi:hypothetical protein
MNASLCFKKKGPRPPLASNVTVLAGGMTVIASGGSHAGIARSARMVTPSYCRTWAALGTFLNDKVEGRPSRLAGDYLPDRSPDVRLPDQCAGEIPAAREAGIPKAKLAAAALDVDDDELSDKIDDLSTGRRVRRSGRVGLDLEDLEMSSRISSSPGRGGPVRCTATRLPGLFVP